MSPAESAHFRAALVHNPRYALRRLRIAPVDYLPLAIEAAQVAEPMGALKISRVLRLVFRTPGQRLLARLVFDSIPHGLDSLAAVAIEAGEILLKRLRSRGDDVRAAKAEILADLSERYQAIGNSRRGLAASRRCVRALRDLATREAGFRPRLIIALQILAKRLSDCGRHFEAIRAAEEAVSEARADANDVASLRRYIAALDTLANRLGAAGNHPRALLTAAKAHDLLLECAKHGEAFEEDLAHSFLNQATTLTHLRKFDEVVEMGLEAWKRFRALAYLDPNKFERMYLAANDLIVGARANLGGSDAAGPQPGESLAVLKSRVRQNPLGNLHRYMVYLVRHSGHLADVVASDEAVDFGEQAADAARKLMKLKGDAHAADEGNVHLHLAKLRASRGEANGSRRAAREAMQRFSKVQPRRQELEEWIREARGLAAGP